MASADPRSPVPNDLAHCPVGLPFGTNHAHEIALSVAAQRLAERDALQRRG